MGDPRPALGQPAGPRRPRAGRLAEGGAFGVLVWAAVGALGLPRLVGVGGLVGLALAAATGAALAWAAPRAARAVALAAAVAYAVVAATPLAGTLIGRVVRRDPLPARPAVDAVVVLASGVNGAGLIDENALSRLVAAAGWARALDRPLVYSVVRLPGRPDAVASAADQRQLLALAGVARLHAVDSVHDTHDEALRGAALARREGWRRVLVVTSPSHSRRACAAFERAGLGVACAPSPERAYALVGPHPLAGPRERVAAFRDWIYEAVGWAVYRARGWV